MEKAKKIDYARLVLCFKWTIPLRPEGLGELEKNVSFRELTKLALQFGQVGPYFPVF